MPRRGAAYKPKIERENDVASTSVLSKQQWDKMHVFSSFVVTDKDGEQYKFEKGDVAAILPHGVDPDAQLELRDYWIGRVREVRAVMHEDDTNEVWVKVQWYYTPANVAEIVKSFNPDACGYNELIFSDHYDIVAHDAFNEVIQLGKFDEKKLDQEYIDPHQLFCRYTFEVKLRAVRPKPGVGTCICSLPYTPSDPNTIVRVCPRPSCRRTFHQTCLLNSKGRGKVRYRDNDLSSRDLRVLSSSPDEDDPVDLEELVSERPKKKRRRRSSRGTTTALQDEDEHEEVQERDLHTALSEIPELLLKIAQHPIVRGGSFGVAGNISPVVRARRMVYTALTQGGLVPDGWEETVLGSWPKVGVIFGEEDEEAGREEETEGTVFIGAVKATGSGRTTRVKVGKGRKEKAGREKGTVNGSPGKKARFAIPALLCPDCGAAI